MWGPALGTKFSPSSCRESCPGPAFLQGLTHARPPGARVAAVLRVVGARVAAVRHVGRLLAPPHSLLTQSLW